MQRKRESNRLPNPIEHERRPIKHGKDALTMLLGICSVDMNSLTSMFVVHRHSLPILIILERSTMNLSDHTWHPNHHS